MISINISDLIWTIINFLLFCFLLNHFLFKPVLRFMDDRQARVDAKLSEKREAEALAEENDARIESEKEKSRDEAKRILISGRGRYSSSFFIDISDITCSPFLR